MSGAHIRHSIGFKNISIYNGLQSKYHLFRESRFLRDADIPAAQAAAPGVHAADVEYEFNFGCLP
jgi:hypothetical protein